MATIKRVESVHTWADGHGSWHATVILTRTAAHWNASREEHRLNMDAARRAARRAITRELAERAPRGQVERPGRLRSYGHKRDGSLAYVGVPDQVSFRED